MSWSIKVCGSKEACKNVVNATAQMPQGIKDLLCQRVDAFKLPSEGGSYRYGLCVESDGHFDGDGYSQCTMKVTYVVTDFVEPPVTGG